MVCSRENLIRYKRWKLIKNAIYTGAPKPSFSKTFSETLSFCTAHRLKQSVSEAGFVSILRWVGSENTSAELRPSESSTQSLAKVAESPEGGSRAGFRNACFNCTVDDGRSAKEVCLNVTPSSKHPRMRMNSGNDFNFHFLDFLFSKQVARRISKIQNY